MAGSKSIYNIGQACLTVDATITAVYCLSHYYHKPDVMDKNVEAFNIAMQVLTSSISTIVIVWSRYQPIWDKLSFEGIKNKYSELSDELKECSRLRMALFVVIAAFGVLSCVARGLSAYLGNAHLALVEA